MAERVRSGEIFGANGFTEIWLPFFEYAREKSAFSSLKSNVERWLFSKSSESSQGTVKTVLFSCFIKIFFTFFSIPEAKTCDFSNNCLHFGRFIDIFSLLSKKVTSDILSLYSTSTVSRGRPRNMTRNAADAKIAPQVGLHFWHLLSNISMEIS